MPRAIISHLANSTKQRASGGRRCDHAKTDLACAANAHCDALRNMCTHTVIDARVDQIAAILDDPAARPRGRRIEGVRGFDTLHVADGHSEQQHRCRGGGGIGDPGPHARHPFGRVQLMPAPAGRSRRRCDGVIPLAGEHVPPVGATVARRALPQPTHAHQHPHVPVPGATPASFVCSMRTATACSTDASAVKRVVWLCPPRSHVSSRVTRVLKTRWLALAQDTLQSHRVCARIEKS